MIQITMKLPSRFSVSRQQLIDIIFLLAVSIVFLSLALYQIELPGLYGDELDKLVPTVALLNGQPFIWVGWYETIFGVRVLLSFTDRIGAVLSYLPMPFILLFDYTPFALRLSSIICAWLTLIFAYFGAKIWFGSWTARFGIALTAVSPVYVFLQRMGYYNYGPVTLFISASFFFLARYISNRNSRNLWVSAALAGIAMNTALQAVFVLIPMALLAILFLKPIRPRLREIIVALCIFLVVSSPILGTALKTGAAFSRIGWNANEAGRLTLPHFIDMLSKEIRHFNGMLGGLDGIQTPSIGKDVRNALMSYAFWLSIPLLAVFFLLAREKIDFIRSNAAPLLITLFGLFLTGFNLKECITYQLIVLWPFVVLAVGAGLAQVPERFRLFAIALTCALVISQANVTIKAHQLLSQNRGRIFTSSQVYPLAHYFKERHELRPVAMDWGLHDQIYFLTGGKVLPKAIHGWWPKDGIPPDEFKIALTRRLKHDNNVYIFFAPGKGMFDRYPHFERLAHAANKTLRIEKIFYEDDGTVAYRLLRATGADTVPCMSSVTSGQWEGEYYNNLSLTGAPSMVRDDGNGFLNFDWGGDSPGDACGLGADNFSVRWTRTAYFSAGAYRFTVTSDDGFRLYINGQLMLDKWFEQASTTYSVDVPLSGGNHVIMMEYFEKAGEAAAKLSWQRK